MSAFFEEWMNKCMNEMRWKLFESQSSQIKKWWLSPASEIWGSFQIDYQLCSLVTLCSALLGNTGLIEWPGGSLFQWTEPWETDWGWLVWLRTGSHGLLGHTAVCNKCLSPSESQFLLLSKRHNNRNALALACEEIVMITFVNRALAV